MEQTQRVPRAGTQYDLDGADALERGGQVADLIAEIVRKDVPTKAEVARRRLPFLLILLALFGGFGTWNFLRITAPPAIPTVQTERATRAQLYLVSSSLDSWKRDHGQLPATLAEAGLDMSGMSYERVDGRYVLIAENGPVRLTYREGQDKAPLAAALGVGGDL